MSKTEFQKIHIRTPVSVLVHGASTLGSEIADALANQGSQVIIIDDYTAEKKDLITKLKKNPKIDFIDFHGIEEIYKTIDRVDYMFYIHYDYLLSNEVLNSRDFLHESNNLNISLKVALKNKAKFTLVTTIALNKKLAGEQVKATYVTPSPYSTSELQKYAETLTAEYHDKSNANVRIIRLGTILGEKYKIHNESLKNIFQDAVKLNTIKIYGEGLETHHLISSEDAIYGLLKLAFDNKTKGEVVSLANENEYTTLSIAYKVLELNPNATEIKFESTQERSPVMHNLYIPAPNASKYGWEQKSQIQDIIHNALAQIYQDNNKQWYQEPDDKGSRNATRTQKKASSKAHRSDIYPEDKEFSSSKSGVSPQKTDGVKTDEVKNAENIETQKSKTVKTGLGKKVSNFFSPFGSKKVKKTLNFTSLLKLSGVTTILVIVYIFLAGPLLSLIITSYLLYQEAKAIATSVREFDTETLNSKIERIHKYSNSQVRSIERVKWLFSIFGKAELYENTSTLVYSINYTIDGVNSASEALVSTLDYLREFQPSVTPDSGTVASTRQYRKELQSIADNGDSLDKATYDIVLGSKLAQEIDLEEFPPFAREEIAKIQELTAEVGDYAAPARESIKLMPEVLGLYERKKYIVLLQNPSEIRSTGGWISSFALIQIEGGQIIQFTVNDVYDLDGKLAANNKFFAAPEEMQNALEIETWNLSLSNWNPDFPSSAKSAEFFIEQAGDIYQADGVIAVNISLIQDLLNVWGGIEIGESTGAKTLINSENLYEKIFEIHNEYVPGSTQKSDFLRLLTDEVLRKVLNFEFSELPLIADTILQGLDQKDLLIDIDSTNANTYLSTEGWNGALVNTYQSAPVAVDWNWGANKANLFLTKSTNLNIDILNKDQIRYSFSQTVTNDSVANVYPEGDYINYFRLFIPPNANVSFVSGFEENAYQTNYSNGFKIIGGWFNTPIKSSNSLEVTYTLNRSQNTTYFPIDVRDDKIVYDLNIYKQPGDMNHLLNLSIDSPDSWALTEANNLASSLGNIEYRGTLNTDKKFTMIWEYK